jgi:SAM-dependent methyltransferase
MPWRYCREAAKRREQGLYWFWKTVDATLALSGGCMTDLSDFEKMEREGWANPAIAEGYAVAFHRATQLVARNLAEAALTKPASMVLDLCTGHGVVAAELLARGAAVTGLDFSAAMISLAQKAVPDVSFVHGDAMSLDFADSSFDAVTIGFGVPHFPDPERGLAEAARVLKPAGRIAFSVWQGKGSDGAFGWLFDALERLGDPAIALPSGPDAHMLADRLIAEPIVTKAGFAEVEVIEVPSELYVQKPEDLFDAFDQGAVRAASLLGGQPAMERDLIRYDLAARTRSQGIELNRGFLVPAPSVIISAVRR